MAKNKTKSDATKKPAPKPVSTPAPKKAEPVARPAKSSASMDKPSKKSALRESILARKAAIKPITFSLDEVRAIAKTNAVKATDAAAKSARPVPRSRRPRPPSWTGRSSRAT